jgi:hypothetical protein
VAINTEILPRLMVALTKSISRARIYRWLIRLSFYKLEVKKGVYVNRHEREDVVAYRQEVFLLTIAKLDLYTRRYEENNNSTWKVIEPELLLGV